MEPALRLKSVSGQKFEMGLVLESREESKLGSESKGTQESDLGTKS